MRKTVHKAFAVWNYDKEEKWLNEMAAKGLCLVSVGFCRYDFEECLPGEYTVQMELLKNSPKHPESEKYIKFIEETGAEHIGNFKNWVYFRKKTADGEFKLYSDKRSVIKQLNLIISAIALILISNITIGISNIYFFFTSDFAFNLIGFLNLALALIMLYGCIRLIRKRNQIKKEQQIFE